MEEDLSTIPLAVEGQAASAADRVEFLKLEYVAIVEKLAAMRGDLARTETIYPFAMFAIYAWLFTHRAPVPWLWSLGMTLPSAIAVLGLVRVKGRLRLMGLLERYSRKIETEFYAGSAPGGWEHLYRTHRPMSGVGKLRLAAGTALLGGSILLSAWAWWCWWAEEPWMYQAVEAQTASLARANEAATASR